MSVKACSDIQEFSKVLQTIETRVEANLKSKIEQNLTQIFESKLQVHADNVDTKITNSVAIIDTKISSNAISIRNIEKDNMNTRIKLESFDQDLANIRLTIQSIESTIDNHNNKHNELDSRINAIVSRASSDERELAQHITDTNTQVHHAIAEIKLCKTKENSLTKELADLSDEFSNSKEVIASIIDNRGKVNIIEDKGNISTNTSINTNTNINTSC